MTQLNDGVPQPPNPPGGLDPIAQTLIREREERAAIEDRLARLERVVSIQIRQIQQLQRIAFGTGSIGSPRVVEPLETPPSLIGELPPVDEQPIQE